MVLMELVRNLKNLYMAANESLRSSRPVHKYLPAFWFWHVAAAGQLRMPCSLVFIPFVGGSSVHTAIRGPLNLIKLLPLLINLLASSLTKQSAGSSALNLTTSYIVRARHVRTSMYLFFFKKKLHLLLIKWRPLILDDRQDY